MAQQPLPNPNGANRVFTLMMGLMAILAAIILLTSCNAYKEKICKTCHHTDSVTITKHDTTIVRDTVLFLSQVGDTITLPCAEKDTVIIRKNAGIVTKVIYKDKQVQCICSDDSLKLVISKIRTDHFAEIDSIRQETFKVKADETWWQKLYRYGFWIELLILIFFIGREVFKFVKWIGTKMP